MPHKRSSFGLTQRFRTYFQFWIEAKSWQSVHSPYIFGLVKHIHSSFFDWKKYRDIERLRDTLKRDKSILSFPDYGDNGDVKSRSVSDILRRSAKNRAQCKVLAQIIGYVKPDVAIELGTSLGISYAYLATAAPNTTLVTIEGAPAIAERASNNLSELGLFGNIKVGNFDEVLPQTLKTLESIDFAYVDGNHQEKSTIEYFNQIAKHLTKTGCIVFDDIYWSQGMMDAWKTICEDTRVSLSVDFYHFGLVFIRPGVNKQHFKLRL